MFKERLVRLLLTNRVGADCVAHFLSRARVLNCDPLDPKHRHVNFVSALDSKAPQCMHSAYGLTYPIMIRSLIKEDVKR